MKTAPSLVDAAVPADRPAARPHRHRQRRASRLTVAPSYRSGPHTGCGSHQQTNNNRYFPGIRSWRTYSTSGSPCHNRRVRSPSSYDPPWNGNEISCQKGSDHRTEDLREHPKSARHRHIMTNHLDKIGPISRTTPRQSGMIPRAEAEAAYYTPARSADAVDTT